MGDDEDYWMQGPYPATPLRALYPDFGTVGDTDKPSREVGIFRRVAELLPAGTRHPKADEFRRLMEGPSPSSPGEGYAAVFTKHLAVGVIAGHLRGGSIWISDLQKDIETYVGEPIAIGYAIGDEIARGLKEENPKGLTKETLEVLQASQLLAPVKVLAAILHTDEKVVHHLIEVVGFIAEDVALALSRAGREWIDEFFEANGDARKQGIMAGEFYGRAQLEAIRFAVEDLITPMRMLP